MKMKEVKARTNMLCPTAMGGKEEQQFCWGTECMAWRWFETRRPSANSSHRMEEIPLDEREGFCGMAGRPA